MAYNLFHKIIKNHEMENYQGIHINTGLKVKGYGATGGLIGGKL